MSRLARALALPVTAAALGVWAAPALAQDAESDLDGRAVGDAGAALVMLRLLPDSVPPNSILPGFAEGLPATTAYEGAFGLAIAEADSETPYHYERAIAKAAPFGGSVGAEARTPPGTLLLTAMPDNDKPSAGELPRPESPLDDLVRATGMRGSVHARWSPTQGPCVDIIAESSTEARSLAMGNAVPTLPNLPMRDLRVPRADGFTPGGDLGTLGGLLAGAEPSANGDGSLVSLPKTLSTRSTVRVADQRGSEGKSVASTSTLDTSAINLLQGSPLGMTITVTKRPELTVTSTGDERTSKVSYRVPELEVKRGKQELFVLDAANPSEDVPIGIPTKGFEDAAEFTAQPIVGGVGEKREGGTERLSDEQLDNVADLFVLRLSVGGLDKRAADATTPYRGHQLGASARLLDVQLLPTEALADALGEQGANLPSALAQISVGDQVAHAYAPAGGVLCGATAPSPGREQSGAVARVLPPPGAAYASVPMLLAGTAALLIGVVLVAAFASPKQPVKPSPHPRR